MKKHVLVVAALLLTVTGNAAVAAEFPKYPQKDATEKRTPKKVEKIIMLLGAIGINDPDVVEFVHDINARKRDGYFSLHEEPMEDGNLSLRYVTSEGVSPKSFELRYVPHDSNYSYMMRPNAVKIEYRYKF